MVEITNQVRNLRVASAQNDVYCVFEDLTSHDVKLSKITRNQLDTLVTGGNQQQLITNAVTIVPPAGYGSGVIGAMRIDADQNTGVVRLVIARDNADANGKFPIYVGRIDGGNFVPCATILIDSRMAEYQPVNGNTKQINVIRSVNGKLYFEGH
jgi:hypothetical protein